MDPQTDEPAEASDRSHVIRDWIAIAVTALGIVPVLAGWVTGHVALALEFLVLGLWIAGLVVAARRSRRGLVAYLAVTLLIALAIGTPLLARRFAPNENNQIAKILILNFDGPDPEKYAVTATVVSNLRILLAPYDDVVVETSDLPFPKTVDRSEVVKFAQTRRASVVVWGWYAASADTVAVSVSLELLVLPKSLTLPQQDRFRGGVRTAPMAGLERFEVQIDLSREIGALALYGAGLAHIAASDWDASVEKFSAALAERTSLRDDERGLVLSYRGYALSALGQFREAITDFDESIALKPHVKTRYNRGLAASALGDYERALVDVSAAVESDPKNYIYLGSRAAINNRMSRYDEALNDFNLAIQHSAASAPAARADLYDGRGDVQFNRKNVEAALEDYTRSLAVDKANRPATLADRGDCYLRLGDRRRAFEDLDRAVAMKPPDAYARVFRGNAWGFLEDYPQAIEEYSRAIEISPRYGFALRARGYARTIIGEYAGAIADYADAIDVDGRDSDALRGRAHVRSLTGDHAGAITDYSAAIELDGHDADALRGRAFARSAIGDNAGAITDYSAAIELDGHAIELDGHDADALRGRAYARAATGDHAGAITDYSAAIELDGHDADALRGRAYARLTIRDWPGAIADYTVVIRADGQDADALRGRAFARRGEDDHAGAIVDYTTALKLNDHDRDALRGRAFSRFAVGDWQGAIDDYTVALEAGLDGEALLGRARARRAAGDTEGAVADYRAALEIEPGNSAATQALTELG